MPLCKKRLECYKFNIDHDMCHSPKNYICFAPISPQNHEAKDSALPPGYVPEITRFFEAMVAEFSGTDNGVDVTLEDYTVRNGLRPFLEEYLKSLGT